MNRSAIKCENNSALADERSSVVIGAVSPSKQSEPATPGHRKLLPRLSESTPGNVFVLRGRPSTSSLALGETNGSNLPQVLWSGRA